DRMLHAFFPSRSASATKKLFTVSFTLSLSPPPPQPTAPNARVAIRAPAQAPLRMIVTSVARLGFPGAPGGETITERRAKIPGVESSPPERQLEPIVLETSRYRVEGKVMLPPTGYHSRLSDHLNNPEREFLIVLDATLTPLDA